MALHRHRHGYAALIVGGAYCERAPEGVWDCREGDLIVHPAFHLHSNQVEAGDARVLNIELSDRAAITLEYGVYEIADPGELLKHPTCPDALAEALASARRKAACTANDWRDAFAQDLAANPARPVGQLAQQFGVSAEHASRAFRARYALTPAAFRAEHRLRAALRDVANMSPLADIAHANGYADQAHMTRSFMASLGVTPARLRSALA